MSGDDQPVHEVASSGDVFKLKALLDRDPALVGAKGWFDRTPLHAAAGAGSLACTRLLVERGADVNARDGLHSETPLFGAAGLLQYKSNRDESLACAGRVCGLAGRRMSPSLNGSSASACRSRTRSSSA